MNRAKYVRLLGLIMVYLLLVSGCTLSTASYNYETALAQFNKGNYDEAKKVIDKVIYVDGDSKKAEFNNEIIAEHLILAGHIYIEIEGYDNAIAAFDKAIKDSSKVADLENNKEALRGKGLVYLRKFEYDKAIEAFNKAKKIEANKALDKDIEKYRIEAYIYGNKTEEAFKFCEDYTKNYGKDDEITLLKGICYAYANNEAEMVKCMSDVIDKGNDSGYYHMAQCYMKLGNFVKASENYEIYLDKAKGIDKKILALAIVDSLVKQGNYDKALELVRIYDKSGTSPEGNTDTKSNQNVKGRYDKEFRQYHITILEKQGNYAEALNRAKDYVSVYTDDEAMKKEVAFLETRIVE